jgi:hypothetical protein
MKSYLYLGKFIQRPGDLAPRGVASTYNEEKLPFNETFERLWNLMKSWLKLKRFTWKV